MTAPASGNLLTSDTTEGRRRESLHNFGSKLLHFSALASNMARTAFLNLDVSCDLANVPPSQSFLQESSRFVTNPQKRGLRGLQHTTKYIHPALEMDSLVTAPDRAWSYKKGLEGFPNVVNVTLQC